MLAGIFFALIAGLMWGLIFVGPLMVPDYPGTLQSMGRYLAFGLIALLLAWQDRPSEETVAPRLAGGFSPDAGRQPSLLRLPGDGDPAHRRANLYHDYRHAAGGYLGECQSVLRR